MYSLVQLSLPRWQLSLRQAGVNTSYMLQPNMTALPHLLFFMADDTGWNNVGWHNPQMHTPNANKLVAEGLTLDRHYVFPYCSPSRSSFMSGRLPIHVQQQNLGNCDLAQGVPRNMTFLSAKLKSAGYRTVHAGKWHLGMSSWGHIPAGRGFDESLVFFAGAEDHLTQRSCTDGECIIPINDTSGSPHDWWQNSSPARATAGSRHSGFQLNDFAVKAVLDHEPDVQPLFMYLAPASSHTPLEPPERFANLYPLSWYEDRRLYAGQCSVWDEILGNVTSALMSKQMWSRTLLVFSSDNGGPVYWSSDPSFPHGAGANNWPLLGGKASNWEGGVRAAAFVSGGILAASLRGTTTSAYVHIADWYATFCELAGVDPTDHVAAKYGLPPIDSLSMVQLISSTNGTSPRQEIPISLDWVDGKAGSSANASALIQGPWKLVQGLQLQTFWQGPEFPNASHIPYGNISENWKLCGNDNDKLKRACLYNIMEDPTEHEDLERAHPDIVDRMVARMEELRRTKYQRASEFDHLACQAQVKANEGFYGPWRP